MILQMALLPIAPIVLLPFIAIFFIVVFPLWVVAVAVLGVRREGERGWGSGWGRKERKEGGRSRIRREREEEVKRYKKDKS